MTQPKLKGKALEGIRYGAKVHDELGELCGNLYSEQWIRFRDDGQYFYCRPDSILETWDRVLVVESKLSLRQLKKGLAQLRLYKPILEHIYNRPVVGVLAFKHWIVGSDGCLPMIPHPEVIMTSPVCRFKKTQGWNYII